jgi:hypothetical protein
MRDEISHHKTEMNTAIILTLAIPAVITFPATLFIDHAGFAALRA